MRRSRSICRPRSAARCCFIPARGGASPASRAGDQRIAQYPPDITGRLARQPLGRPAGGDPGLEIARPPIVGSERIRPIAVALEHLRQISPAEKAVLAQVEAVDAAVIERRLETVMHRALW